MLQLQIRFESSWTNFFFDQPGGAPLFTSGSQFSKSAKNLQPADASLLTQPDSHSRIPYLRALQEANPELKYRVPESYDRTVQGVLTRLTGEVRRLADLQADHLALRAYWAGSYAVDIEHEHSQTTKLATYETNAIQSGGAGLIMNETLYTSTREAKYLFGFLQLSLEEMQARVDDILAYGFDDPSFQWTPASPSILMERLQALGDAQQERIDALKKKEKDEQVPYITPYLAFCEAIAQKLPQEAQAYLADKFSKAAPDKLPASTVDQGALDAWPLAGAVIVARIKSLNDADREAMIQAGALTRAGNLGGLSMNGGVGNFTEKDVFRNASGQGAESNRMPYSAEIPLALRIGGKDIRATVPSGVIKKTGRLTFSLDGNDALEDELAHAIGEASVGPFHFGKKGIAYVERMQRF